MKKKSKHVKIGKRFMDFYDVLESARSEYTYAKARMCTSDKGQSPPEDPGEGVDYIDIHLQRVVHKKITGYVKTVSYEFLGRNGTFHNLVKAPKAGPKKEAKGIKYENARMEIPAQLRRYIRENSERYKGSRYVRETKPSKVPLAWYSCYLEDNHPDKTIQGWEYFQCSHRCVGLGIEEGYQCIGPDCLVWETAAENQSRANAFCRKKCEHPGCEVDGTICWCNYNHTPHCV